MNKVTPFLVLLLFAATPVAADQQSPLFGSSESEPFQLVEARQPDVPQAASESAPAWILCANTNCPNPLKLAKGAPELAAAP
jgi:hypothetical protein